MDSQNMKVFLSNMMKKKCKVNIFDYFFTVLNGSPPNLPVSKPPVMKSKNPNLASANTPETKTAKIHNAYLQNSQCQNAQFYCITTSS
jgi:hypothetical protein